jgi:hypothetical protein
LVQAIKWASKKAPCQLTTPHLLGCSIALSVVGAEEGRAQAQGTRNSGGSSRAFLSKGGSQSAIKQIRKEIPAERFLPKQN